MVDYLVRKANQDGGFACLLTSGDAMSGGILIQCLDRGNPPFFLEKRTDFDGNIQWIPAGPDADSTESDQLRYVEKRAKMDPDLWVIELDIADTKRFVVENGSFR